MTGKYDLLAERLRPYGFEPQVLREDAVVMTRYAMDDHLQQNIQLVEQEAKNSKVRLHASVDVLDRIDTSSPRGAPNFGVEVREVDRHGHLQGLDVPLDDYDGWDYGEVESIADVAVKFALPWLDSWTDPHKIIQYILNDSIAREAAVAKWDAEAAKEITFLQRLRGQRAADPSTRPRSSPPMYQIMLANLYLYVGNKPEAVKYLTNVCASHPGWKGHHEELVKLRKSLGQES